MKKSLQFRVKLEALVGESLFFSEEALMLMESFRQEVGKSVVFSIRMKTFRLIQSK